LSIRLGRGSADGRFASPAGLVPVTLFGEGDSWRLFRGNGDAPRSRLLVRLAERETWDLADRWRWYFHDPIFINAEAGRWTRGNLPPDALLAGDQMGQFGFYAHEDQRIIDLIGLMDRTVARSGLTVEYLAQRSPDYLVVQTNDGSAYWPREQRRAPSVPQIAEVFRSGGVPPPLPSALVPALTGLHHEDRLHGVYTK
jgi:hypothetical protein